MAGVIHMLSYADTQLAYGQVRRWDARIPAASYVASAYMIVLGFAPETRQWQVMQLDGDNSGTIIALSAETITAWPLVEAAP